MSDTPIGFLLVDAARLYRARMDRAFSTAGLGLTAGEARTLAYIHRHPGLRQCMLALKMNVEPMTLVGFLDRLEALGLVVRQIDPSDRRAKIVHLAPVAGPYVERVQSVAAEARTEALAGFSDADQQQLRRFLEQISDNLADLARAKEER